MYFNYNDTLTKNNSNEFDYDIKSDNLFKNLTL